MPLPWTGFPLWIPGSYVTLFVGRRRLIVPGKWDTGRFNMLRDVLRDTWAYQEIMQEGREEERQQRLKDQRQILMTIIQTHFPNITDLAQKRVDAIKDPETLQSLVLKMSAAQIEDQAKQALLEVAKIKKKK